MGGPTNTQPRYRPPPPGTAPPPPPPASSDGGGGAGAVMGGGQPQPQYQQPQQSYYEHQPQPQPQQSYYAQQQQQPQQSYYAQGQQQQQQQSQPQPQPSQTPRSAASSGQSYAERSAAAHSPHGSQHNNQQAASPGNVVTNTSNHSNGSGNQTASKPKPKSAGESPFQAAEQTRLLNNATQKVTEHAYHMQRAMENNDVCSALEKACLLLEELGDPNHGLHHRGGTGNRGGQGGGVVGGAGQYGPPGYYSSGGGVPPLGNYSDRPYGAGGGSYGGGGHHGHHGHGSHGWITPLTPKNYYELHMRAMDEMPSLEEYLLGLCHVHSVAPAGAVGSGATNAGPSNYSTGQKAPYSTEILYETVQYCPRVVPRLYLQICMGAVSIRSGSTTAVKVMEELGEAAKCVQCPVRGLFLRYYLLMALKDKLPDGSLDDDSEEEKEEEQKAEDIMSPLSPVEPGEEILGASEPTSPPPALPPPPPPATDGPLFETTPETGETPLFADEPLGEEPKTTAPTSAASPEKAAKKEASPKKAPPKTYEQLKKERQPGEEGNVVDSYEFILRNLLEMNRLWIRIQHMPGDKTKETRRRRERERNDLRILVGSNLNRLSQLEGLTAHTYGSKILPRILEEIATCRDPLAQAYLMDCVIQVFPEEFHLETLEVFLGVCPKLREKVNVRTILTNMMERLINYYKDARLSNDEEDTNDVKLMMAYHSFDMFEDCVVRVFEARGLNIPPKDIVRLQGCLLNYALKIAPENRDFIQRCIGTCARALGTLQDQKKASMMGQGIVMGGGTKKSTEIDMCDVATKALEEMLSVPLDSMGLKVLDMPDFSALLAFLPWENRRKVAVSMVKSVISGGESGDEDKRVKSVNELEQLFAILAPLLRDEGTAAPAMYDDHSGAGAGGSLISRTANLMGTLGISPSVAEHNELFGGATANMSFHHAQSFHGDAAKLAQFREEQSLVAKLVHVLDHEDTDVAYQMLTVARRHVQPGGSTRVMVTLPAVVFEALKLLRKVQDMEYPEPIPAPVAVLKDEKKEKEGGEAAEETKEAQEESGAVDEEKEDPKEDKNEEEAGTTDPAAASKDAVAEKDSPEEDGPDKSEIKGETTAVEEEKEEKTETEPSPPVTKEEPTKQLFPEFIKSVNCRKILVFLQKTVAMLAPSNPELAFKLYLEIAVATDLLAHSTQKHFSNASSEFCSISYDFLTQAFLVYEDEISESSAQIRAITSIVGSLLLCKTFEKADYEALITKTAQYAAKLLKKPDQCRMVCLCSRLFYVGGKDDVNTYRNPQRVLECLQRGLKIADACSMSSSSNVQLFVEILDYYVYYYEIENPVITDKFVSGLIALINEHFDSAGSGSGAVAEARAYYGQILDHIRRKKMKAETKERFGLIVC